MTTHLMVLSTSNRLECLTSGPNLVLSSFSHAFERRRGGVLESAPPIRFSPFRAIVTAPLSALCLGH